MAIDQFRFRMKFPIWSVDEIGKMTAQEWKMACCPRHLANCPAIVDDEDELVCPRCRPLRRK
jgi:hypothetical protein